MEMTLSQTLSSDPSALIDVFCPHLFDEDEKLVLKKMSLFPKHDLEGAIQQCMDVFASRNIIVASLLAKTNDAEARDFFLKRAELHADISATLKRIQKCVSSRYLGL